MNALSRQTKERIMTRIFQRSGVAFAALIGAAMSLNAHAAGGQLPPEHQAGVASYVSGGIGDGQAQQFEAAFKRYPLVIKLFEGTGGSTAEFTAEARVKITDAKGGVALEARAEGPYMLVRLPAGNYRVGASLNGKSLADHQVHVTDSGHFTTTFVFPKNTG
jgi:hypothetical protein